MLDYLAIYWQFGVIGGLGSMSSYGIALWTMALLPIPMVAAARDLDRLWYCDGWLRLREPAGAGRLDAAASLRLGAAILPGLH